MLMTEHLFIRLPEYSDVKMLKEFEEKNKEQLKRNGSTELIVSSEQWDTKLVGWFDDYHKERALRFLVFHKESKVHLMGIINYTHIMRGSLQSTYLGYYADYEYASLGLLAEALQATITYVFNYYRLHRIIATYQPNNLSAAHILKLLGFRVEGYAYEFMLTEAGWQDHILTALINTDWQEKRLGENVIYTTKVD